MLLYIYVFIQNWAPRVVMIGAISGTAGCCYWHASMSPMTKNLASQQLSVISNGFVNLWTGRLGPHYAICAIEHFLSYTLLTPSTFPHIMLIKVLILCGKHDQAWYHYDGITLICDQHVKMPRYHVGTRPSATTMLTPLWLWCQVNHVTQQQWYDSNWTNYVWGRSTTCFVIGGFVFS